MQVFGPLSMAVGRGFEAHAQTAELDAVITAVRDQSIGAESEHSLLLTLISHLPVLVYAKDRAGRFIVANDAVARFMGTESGADLIGRTDFEFYRSDQAASSRADEEQIMATGDAMVNKDELNVDREGRVRWLLTTKVPLRNSEGEITGIVGIGKDITERKKLEAERDQYVERLQYVLENLRRLQGLITICSSCKKIRDDVGFWHEVEAFMSQYTDMEFTHSICPECHHSLYGSTRDLEAVLASAKA